MIDGGSQISTTAYKGNHSLIGCVDLDESSNNWENNLTKQWIDSVHISRCK